MAKAFECFQIEVTTFALLIQRYYLIAIVSAKNVFAVVKIICGEKRYLIVGTSKFNEE
jgi:hypothetical protein